MKSIDAFAHPITLTFYKKNTFSTVSGGFLTIAMIAILVVLSINKIDDVIHHQNLTASTTESIQSIPPANKINNFFAFVFEPAVLNSLTGKVYFDFEVTWPFYTRLSNGTQIKDKSRRYTLTRCNETHFPMFSRERLVNYGVFSWLCADLPADAAVSGEYNSPLYKFIQMKVSKCGTSNITRKLNDTCASDEEIEGLKLANGGKIYLNLKYVNYLINLNDFEQPFLPYIDQITFLVDFPNTFLQKELSLTSTRLFTDPSIWYTKNDYSQANLQEHPIYEGRISELALSQPQNETGRINYISIYFKSDTKAKKINRKYSTFQDVMQMIGSFWSLFFSFFGVLSRALLKYKFPIKLANSLYIFPGKETKIAGSDLQSPANAKNTRAKSKLMRILTRNRNTLHDLSTLRERQKIQKFKFSYWQFFKEIFKKKDGDYQVKDIQDVVNRGLDINKILQTNLELEKLKHVLLTKEQETLFNFSMKPTFAMVQNESSINFLKYQQKVHKKKKSLANFADNYLNQDLVKSFGKLKQEKNELSCKIISILDKDVSEVLEKHYQNRLKITNLEEIKDSLNSHDVWEKDENVINEIIVEKENEIELVEIPEEMKENEVKNKVKQEKK